MLKGKDPLFIFGYVINFWFLVIFRLFKKNYYYLCGPIFKVTGLPYLNRRIESNDFILDEGPSENIPLTHILPKKKVSNPVPKSRSRDNCGPLFINK